MTIQLNPPIEVLIPGKGYGWAVLHIDYGPGLNGVFLVILDESRAFLYVDVTLLKAAENLAFGFNKSLTAQEIQAKVDEMWSKSV